MPADKRAPATPKRLNPRITPTTGGVMSFIEINITLQTEDPALAIRASETLNRATLGLAFEGVRIETSVDRIDLDDYDGDDELADTKTEDDA